MLLEPASKLGQAVAKHAGLDLDLRALYELANGRKSVVQALGNASLLACCARMPHLVGKKHDTNGWRACSPRASSAAVHRERCRGARSQGDDQRAAPRNSVTCIT